MPGLRLRGLRERRSRRRGGLLRRARPSAAGRRAFDPGKGLWDLPGGFLHEDEHPLDALHREIREETALDVEPIDFLGFWLEPYDGRIVLCLAWTVHATGEPRAGDDLVELRWFEPDELPPASELAFVHYP